MHRHVLAFADLPVGFVHEHQLRLVPQDLLLVHLGEGGDDDQVADGRPAPKREAAARSTSAPAARAGADAPPPAATAIETVRTSRKGGSTLVTIAGNGKLTPTGVSEARDLPRRGARVAGPPATGR